MTAYRSVSACCDHPDCQARVSDMSAIWDIKTLGWWVSDDSLPLYGSLAALCPDHAPEED